MRDRITGIALFAVALIWSALVVWTIPAGQGGGDVGARAFPLLLGILLGLLAALVILASFFETAPAPQASVPDAGGRLEYEIVGSVFVGILGYGFLMEKVGFVLATPVFIAALMITVLRSRSPVKISAMSIGLTAGCWLLFGNLLGAYLPRGSWISLG